MLVRYWTAGGGAGGSVAAAGAAAACAAASKAGSGCVWFGAFLNGSELISPSLPQWGHLARSERTTLTVTVSFRGNDGAHRTCDFRRGVNWSRCACALDRFEILAGAISTPRFPVGLRPYLIANGLVGEPTAPVIGIAGATNMN